MIVLVTGANGFVGKHLREALISFGHRVVSTDITGDVDVSADLLSEGVANRLLADIKPDAIVHLAGQSSVALSWKKPKWTETLNVHTTLNLLDAMVAGALHARMLVIGSAEQYGLMTEQEYMVTEQTPCKPINPYAISKNAQEQLSLALARSQNLDVLCTRSFNHIGPGQGKGFVLSDFSSGIVAIERGAETIMRVGNLDVFRDFTDVRDVVRAYCMLLERGKTGEVYNVGSGTVVAIRQLLHDIIALSHMPIQIEQDPARMRAANIPRMGCNHDKLTADTGWMPQIPLQESIQSTLAWWRTQ